MWVTIAVKAQSCLKRHVGLFFHPFVPGSPSTQHYDYLFNINDKKKGGSFYLQSKVRGVGREIGLSSCWVERKTAQKDPAWLVVRFRLLGSVL